MNSLNNLSLLSIKDVAELLEVTESTVRNWIKGGIIKVHDTQSRNIRISTLEIEKLEKKISEGTVQRLRSRRNKTRVSGNTVYASYLPTNSQDVIPLESWLNDFKKNNKEISKELLFTVLGIWGLRLLLQIKFNDKDVASIIKNLLSHKKSSDSEFVIKALKLTQGLFPLFLNEQKFNVLLDSIMEVPLSSQVEDILGFLYLSLNDLGARKKEGHYYTPHALVSSTVAQVVNEHLPQGNVIDPASGSGNFIIELAKYLPWQKLFMSDIDPIAIKLARINFSIFAPEASFDEICSHVKEQDFITYNDHKTYDLVIGNPPWGKKYKKSELTDVLPNIELPASCDSFAVFYVKALLSVANSQRVYFVIPEAGITVDQHKWFRKFICDKTEICYFHEAGNAFKGVFCSASVIGCCKTSRQTTSNVNIVLNNGEKFDISGELSDSSLWKLFLEPEEIDLANRFIKNPNARYLKGQSDFALGIVTGNNAEFIKNEKFAGSERIISGADISPYEISESMAYIKYDRERLRQVAPDRFYRAPEKILYRFIATHPIATLDTEKLLPLNSVNVLIPKITNLPASYIVAVLNSKAVEWYFKKVYRTLKVLRQQLEDLPLPAPDYDEKITNLAKAIFLEKNKDKRAELISKVDLMVSRAYGFSEEEHLKFF